MAFQEYDVTASIQKMTARQLRLYISRAAEEANKRIESSKDIPVYMQDIITDERLKGHISQDGNFLKGTSFMNKQQMQDYAKQLRDFNFMDTSSKYAKDTDYKENKDRYESFVRERLKDPQSRAYWEKYVGKNGRILKKGYEDYKEYINTIKSLLPYIEAYGYGAVKKYFAMAKDNFRDPDRVQTVERLLVNVYEENRGKGLNQGELNDKFMLALNEYDREHFDTDEALYTYDKTPKVKVKKPKKPKSGNNVKVKTGKKMKGETIRERQGTS